MPLLVAPDFAMMTYAFPTIKRGWLLKTVSWAVCMSVGVLVAGFGGATVAVAQQSIHYFHSANLPPGTVGQGQLLRNQHLRGYFQPVEIQVPDGVQVSGRVDGQFSEPHKNSLLVGMQVGPVYEFRVTNLPYSPGAEVYPTIELVNRLYPPPALRQRFPVPVQLTGEEIRFALEGRYVTRVIYLEDPTTALPQAETPGFQRYFEAPSGQDPLRVADQLGRPLAILRMGSRVPETDDPDAVAHGSAPMIVYPDQPEKKRPILENDSPAIERSGHDVPRVPE